MNHKRLLAQMIGLTLVLLLVACGAPQSRPTPTPIPPTPTPSLSLWPGQTFRTALATRQSEVPSPTSLLPPVPNIEAMTAASKADDLDQNRQMTRTTQWLVIIALFVVAYLIGGRVWGVFAMMMEQWLRIFSVTLSLCIVVGISWLILVYVGDLHLQEPYVILALMITIMAIWLVSAAGLTILIHNSLVKLVDRLGLATFEPAELPKVPRENLSPGCVVYGVVILTVGFIGGWVGAALNRPLLGELGAYLALVVITVVVLLYMEARRSSDRSLRGIAQHLYAEKWAFLGIIGAFALAITLQKINEILELVPDTIIHTTLIGVLVVMTGVLIFKLGSPRLK